MKYTRKTASGHKWALRNLSICSANHQLQIIVSWIFTNVLWCHENCQALITTHMFRFWYGWGYLIPCTRFPWPLRPVFFKSPFNLILVRTLATPSHIQRDQRWNKYWLFDNINPLCFVTALHTSLNNIKVNMRFFVSKSSIQFWHFTCDWTWRCMRSIGNNYTSGIWWQYSLIWSHKVGHIDIQSLCSLRRCRVYANELYNRVESGPTILKYC